MSQELLVGEMPVRGTNLLSASNVLPEGYGRYLQDVLIESDGSIRRRGPLLLSDFDVHSDSTSVNSMVYAYTPTGTLRIMAMGALGASSDVFRVFSAGGSALGDFTGALGVSAGSFKSQWCSDFNGGAIIGVPEQSGSQQWLQFWRGSYTHSANPGATIGATTGSTALSASGATFTAGHVGGFVYLNGDYVGCIKSVTSGTAAVLEEGSLRTYSGAVATITPIRGLYVAPSPGLIHAETVGAAIVGSGTKFLDLATAANTWDIFHLRNDTTNSFVGTLSAASVTNNTSIALASPSVYNMDFERYKLVRRADSSSTRLIDASAAFNSGRNNLNTVGCLPTPYADCMWYANRGDSQENKSSIWFSERFQSENIDMSPTTGNKITVGSDEDRGEIVATIGTSSGLLIFKNRATYILTGKSRANFKVDKLWDDGALSARSVNKYKSGACWAGNSGIYYFDGSSVTNVIEHSMGDQYQTLLQAEYIWADYCISWVSNDHLFVSFTDSPTGSVEAKPWYTFTKNIYAPIMREENPDYYADNYTPIDEESITSVYDDVTSDDSGEAITFCINLSTGALVFMRNMKVSWALNILGVVGGSEDNLLCITDQSRTDPNFSDFESPGCAIVGTSSIFTKSGLDQVDTCYNGNTSKRSPKSAYWQTFYDSFSTGVLNSNWTQTGSITVTPGQFVPANTSLWSLELLPAWTAGQPHNFMRMHFTTGSTITGFANRMRIYNSNKSNYIEAEVNATDIRLLIDGVEVATTAHVPTTATEYYFGFWFWAGWAVAVIYDSSSPIVPNYYGTLPSGPSTYVAHELNSIDLSHMQNTNGGGRPYFAGDVAAVSEIVHDLAVVPLKQSAGPRLYVDTGIKPLESINAEKWTKNVTVSYVAASGSINAYILNDIDADLNSSSNRLPSTLSIANWSDGTAAWKFQDNRPRNWPRYAAFFSPTAPLIDTKTLDPWGNKLINVGDRGQGVGVRIVQDHLQTTDVRLRGWTIGFKHLRPVRNG